MKKIYLLASSILLTLGVNAQWNSNTNGIHYEKGKVGVGTILPKAQLHVESPMISTESVSSLDANLLVVGKGSSKKTNFGSAIGFVVPADTNGGNPWQQGRIMVTPDNVLNRNANGRMYLQTRALLNSKWRWRNNLVLRSSGKVGVGTANPEATFEIESPSIDQSSYSRIDANLVIQGVDSKRSTTKGATLGFVVPADTNGGNPWQQGRIMVTPDNENNRNANGRMYLQTRTVKDSQWRWTNNLVLRSNGKVGIGTDNPDAKLTVKGGIHAQEVNVDLNGVIAPDYVFDKNYNLISLEETEKYISEHKHLPEIPSAAEMEKDGFELKTMNLKLLQKVEELTLHTIAQEKKISDLENANKLLDAQNKKFLEIEKRLLKLESK